MVRSGGAVDGTKSDPLGSSDSLETRMHSLYFSHDLQWVWSHTVTFVMFTVILAFHGGVM